MLTFSEPAEVGGRGRRFPLVGEPLANMDRNRARRQLVLEGMVESFAREFIPIVENFAPARRAHPLL